MKRCIVCEASLSARNRSGRCRYHNTGRPRHTRATCPCGQPAARAGARYCSHACGYRYQRRPVKLAAEVGPWGGRKRAQRAIPALGPCERCGRPGHDRHHRDHDPTNTDTENLEVLCRSCHVREHRAA